MYHQFKELADVDITQEPMEIGPTCHYVMGGVEVEPDTEMSGLEGLYAVGECSGGMHGSNRLGGNSLSDLLVFGKRAGDAAAAYVSGLGGARPRSPTTTWRRPRSSRWRRSTARAPGTENPYTIQQELQQTMNDLVGIIRIREELEKSLGEIEKLKERAKNLLGRGRPSVQPRLAPRDRPAQHAAGLRVHREGRARARGVARRTHPRGPPGLRRGVGHAEHRAVDQLPRATASTWPPSRCR